ncbi:MAG: hypothetical protein C4293_10300, partial [Nitrospiraceae bacterium]
MFDLLVILIPVLPLLAVLLNGLWGHRYSHPIAARIACGSVGVSFLLAVAVFIDTLQSGQVREVVA